MTDNSDKVILALWRDTVAKLTAIVAGTTIIGATMTLSAFSDRLAQHTLAPVPTSTVGSLIILFGLASGVLAGVQVYSPMRRYLGRKWGVPVTMETH